MSKTKRRLTGEFNAPMLVYVQVTNRLSVGIPKKGKSLAKTLAKYHSDAGHHAVNRPSKWFRQQEEAQFRAGNRTELNKGHDLNYEVQILGKKKIDYWD
jgi:hypothetical protein